MIFVSDPEIIEKREELKMDKIISTIAQELGVKNSQVENTN